MIWQWLRPIFRFSSAVSLLLLVAICIVWVRSYSLTDRISSRSAGGVKTVYSRRGQLVLYVLRADWSKQPASALGMDYQRDEPRSASIDLSMRQLLCSDTGATEVFWEHGSFAWWDRHRSDGVLYLMTVAPFWSFAVATGILPAVWGGLRIRREFAKGRAGICRDCGYDLRATPQRCPECGRAVVG